jgi:flagellar motor switch/type III secretory pathway protein FliN
MKSLTALRSVDEQKLPVENSAARLSYMGYQPHYERFLADKHYLRFHAIFDDCSEMDGFVDVATWLNQSLPSIAGMDWFSMDEQVLCSLMSAYPLQIELVNQHTPFKKITIVKLVGATDELAELPRLAMSTGAICVEKFVYGISETADNTATQKIEKKLSIHLDFIVGYSKFPISSLAAIEVGDLLLIEQVDQHICSNNKTLFEYTLTQESVVIIEHIENQEQQSITVEKFNSGEPGGLNSLPVELSFVLMEKTVTFAELKAMAPGEVVALPLNQVMQVDIRANQRSFCSGELVQLANGKLAVEIRQIRK